ncbi:asialoglycoprotein receptor 1-like isoform X1 [Sander lucioperca]|uniref:asialoglycoprotein receptor 1-like isoform X1 n=1 Tax=Sander lucioperca TaxID=283035 RepID=UPI001653D26E|nr:asialoglycoprotein receptor 1-like isoform X1 [Sander lucioperca]
MSEDIYAKPDMSKKVRYKRTVQEDKGEWEEREVEIYESTDAIRDDHIDYQSHGGGPDTERHPPAVQRKTFRAAALCLAVLCFLMMTGIILLSVYFTLLQTRYDQLSNNNSQLQVKVSDISVNYSQLQPRYKVLQTRYDQLSNNNSQLQSSYETLSVNHSKLQDEVKQLKDRTEVILLQTRYDQLSNNYSQLQDEVKQLKNRTEEKCCCDGWTRFGCSCYFKSKEKKTWSGRRADCQQRGADLVIINNKEEQKFVTELNKDGESWIGLRYVGKQGGWKWEWVDKSPLTETFWAAGLTPDYYLNAATCCDQQGKWTQRYSENNKNWICEKKI